MSFYDALQMDPSVLKKKISQSNEKKEKVYYWAAITVRAILIVAFAILFITTLSNIFGTENTPMAVVLFCILLGIRFVNFEYCIGDSLVTLAIAFATLLFVPAILISVPTILIPFIHFIAIFAILCITSQRPELGNGGLYSFAYIYLVGNPVSGELLTQRAMMTLVGYIICAVILFVKHRHIHSETRFHHVIKRFTLKNPTHLWQLRMAIGVTLVLSIGSIFKVERFMWMGFACSSLLSEYPYSPDTKTRFGQRVLSVLIGSAAFFVIFQIMPESIQPLIGPLGGLCLGFCTKYRYKTALNCFGALMIGAGIYGIHGAVIIRIIDTILGVVIGYVFAYIFHKLIALRFLPDPNEEN